MFLPRPSIDNVSRTALGICAYCALISRHPALRRVYYDPFAEALFGAAAAKGNEILADLPDWAAVEAARQDLGDDVRLLCHVAWRKRWMSDHARAHLAQGIDQVVILGAGLDTLSLRLGPAYPGAVFFEVDQTATVAAKRALVAQLFGPPPHVRYTAVDFAAETAEARLLDTGYDPARPAIFIAEVSLEYVPKEDVAETYRMVRRNGSDRSVFLTTYVLRPDAPESARIVQTLASTSGAGEPMRFTPTEDEARVMCADLGFVVEDWMQGAGVLDYLGGLGVTPCDLPFDVALQRGSTLTYAALRPG